MEAVMKKTLLAGLSAVGVAVAVPGSAWAFTEWFGRKYQ